MAFLKFLEKDGKLGLPDDLPPLPPLSETKISSLDLPPLESVSLDANNNADKNNDNESFNYGTQQNDNYDLPELPPLPGKEELAKMASGPVFPEIPENEPPKELPPFPDEEIAEKANKIGRSNARAEKTELKELRKRLVNKPFFVSVDDFREILGDLDKMNIELRNHDKILHNVEEIKSEQDKLFELWHSKLKDLERKFVFVDRTLFETESV